jgi:hypothetical protein
VEIATVFMVHMGDGPHHKDMFDLKCARCHDHKFNPLPQTDYYGLAGAAQPLVRQAVHGLVGRRLKGGSGGRLDRQPTAPKLQAFDLTAEPTVLRNHYGILKDILGISAGF